jgi:hypothetical protein
MAGPFCTVLLGDLGADVIKIEPPGTGDQTRSAMGFKRKGPDSMGFLNMNRNKRSVTQNWKSEAGKKAFYKLAETADILVDNPRPRASRDRRPIASITFDRSQARNATTRALYSLEDTIPAVSNYYDLISKS